MSFQIADSTNGISARQFLTVGNGGGKFRQKNAMSADEYATFSQRMKVGAYVRMRGDVVYDTYVNDYVFNANDIMADDEGVTVEREDNNPTPRVELHLHTVMSDMDALITVKQLIKTIKKWGHPAIAVTDHGVVQSFPLLQELSTDKTNNIKVITAWKDTCLTKNRSVLPHHHLGEESGRHPQPVSSWSAFPI